MSGRQALSRQDALALPAAHRTGRPSDAHCEFVDPIDFAHGEQPLLSKNLVSVARSYIFGDVLTEVYGYGRDRRVVWAGFAALAFATFMSLVVLNMPVAPFMADYQKSLQEVFGNTWRIALGSLIAFCCGSFTNSYVLAKMKLWTSGRWLWTRTIGSTLAGELVDSSLFYVIAFYGIWPLEKVIQVAVAQYVLKTGWEVVMTPVTYKVVGFLKRAENEDYFDRNTDFTPFRVRV
ncbi:queuosine precursor transporter [Cupriavidus necator]|uniref:queuosine precursor transporter n=1 Tax=Cupriavidus necator TaxID=106590 RepID=UPI0023EF4AAE|nr:queuosine precursor transporter [Cupriavidus necator]